MCPQLDGWERGTLKGRKMIRHTVFSLAKTSSNTWTDLNLQTVHQATYDTHSRIEQYHPVYMFSPNTLKALVSRLYWISVADNEILSPIWLRPDSPPTDDDDSCTGQQCKQGEQGLLVGVDEAGQGVPGPHHHIWTSSCSEQRGTRNTGC